MQVMKYKLIISRNKTRISVIYVEHNDKVQQKLINVLQEKGAQIVEHKDTNMHVYVHKSDGTDYDYYFKV